jgi:L-ascorbate metabolism protein UlaG (beta-lactamase superfamily)
VEIEWYGHSCFRIREQGVVIITDPYDKGIGYSMPKVRADIVTVSHESPNHASATAVKGDPKLVSKPGEYEVKGVFITGIQTWLDAGKGAAKEENVVYVLEFNDLTVCHLGDLSRVLTQAQVEAMPTIDILMVPVGGGGALDADQAAEVISLLEPKIVLPMHYRTDVIENVELDPISKFLREMGVSEHSPAEGLKMTKSDLPEATQVVILDYKQG